jgi:phosphoserine phosphatase RsbU/P
LSATAISNGKSASADLSELSGSVRGITACLDNCRLSSLAGLRKCEAAERCSCSHRFCTVTSVRLSETRLALIIADVSGKGMPAALLMSNLQATAKAYATAESSPKDLCREVNRAICNSIILGKFITCFYGVLDWESRRLTYTNAGHNPPLIVSQDRACRRLETGGAVLGVFADGSYEQASIDLLPGDSLVMYTDGITEATDSHSQEFGEGRLISLLRERSTARAADLRDAIMQDVTQFCREDFADDATLLTLVIDRSALNSHS